MVVVLLSVRRRRRPRFSCSQINQNPIYLNEIKYASILRHNTRAP